MFRPQEISATDARKYFSQIINKVQFSSKSFTIKTYRKPVVRIVREEYIAALEQVLGKKTVSQVLQISGDDNLFDATKIIEIKKIFQRRLSGAQRPERRPERVKRVEGRPQPQQPQKPRPPQQKQVPAPQPPVQRKQGVAAGPRPAEKQKKSVTARHVSPKPQSQTQEPTTKPTTPVARPAPPTSKRSRRVLLLSNGKNYK